MAWMRIEVLYFDGCPNHEALLPHVRPLLDAHGIDAPVHLHEITSLDAAVAQRFLGSPTLRVDGEDVDPGASERDDYGLKCRLYAADGALRGLPPDEWVLAALEVREPRPG